MTGHKIRCVYRDEPRKGDHVCYITNLRKFTTHYPDWRVTRDLRTILLEIVEGEKQHERSVHTA